MDQSENLDTLAQDAQLIDTSVDPRAEQRQQQQAQQQEQVLDSNVAELMGAATIIRGLWIPLVAMNSPRKAEALAHVWSDGVLMNAAQAGAKVLALHGVQMGDVLGRYAPYVALVAALAQPVMATAQIMRVQEAKPADVVQPPAGEGGDSGQAG